MENQSFDWENGYYIGKEYIEDPETIEVLIKYGIKTPVIFDNFNIDISDKLKVRQGKGLLYVNVHKTISKKLFNDVVDNLDKSVLEKDVQVAQTHVHSGNFIIGYIRPTLPIIIDEIYKRKYLEGHILMHTISLSDIVDVCVLNIKGKGAMIAQWPIPISGFPPSKSLTKEADAIYIRDFIDAMTLYFAYNIDESIRKVITSLENYLIHYNLKIKGEGLKKLIKYYIIEDNYPFKEHNLKILMDNIIYIYELRNSIVHDKLRFSATQFFIAKKAIGTLSYIYQSRFMSKSDFQYIFSLTQQFLFLEKQYNGIDLDEIADTERNTKEPDDLNIIDSKDKLDDFIFGELHIKNKEKLW